MTKLMKDVLKGKLVCKSLAGEPCMILNQKGNGTYILNKTQQIAICSAVNSHDTLTEQNKQLVEALDDFDRFQGNDNDYLNSPFCAKVRELLFKHGACQEDERPKLKEHELIAKHKE